MKRYLTAVAAVLLAVILCCSAAFASGMPFSEEMELGSALEGVSFGEVDIELLTESLGLSMEELEQLVEGEMSPSELDLSQVDLEGVVDALGMTEEDVHDTIRAAVGVEDLDLSGLKLNEVDVEALLESTGLTVDDIVKMGQGESPADFEVSQVDPEAMLHALGLSGDELIDIALSAAGLGGFDWRGTLTNIGMGALIGFGAAAIVVALFIVLLAVKNRKRTQHV